MRQFGGSVASGCGATPLAADAAQRQTTVQVSSTANFSVGQWVLIDEASGAGWVDDPMRFGAVRQLWAASDWLNSSGSPATGRVMWAKSKNGGGWDFGSAYPYQAGSVGCWYSYCDRPTQEMHKIASIGAGPCPGTGCTLTFDDPLTVAFRQSGNHNAQVYSGPYSNQSGTPIDRVQVLEQAIWLIVIRKNHCSSWRTSTSWPQRSQRPSITCSLASTVWSFGHHLTAASLR